MDIVVVKLTTASHRADPKSGKGRTAVRLSTKGKAAFRYLFSNQAVPAKTVRPVITPPVVPIIYTEDSLDDVLGGYAQGFPGAPALTAFLINEQQAGKAFKAGLSLVEGRWADAVVTSSGLQVESTSVIASA